MNRDTVQAWLDGYVAAWASYDPDAIGALFSADATYLYHPWDEGDEIVRGRDAIVRAWTAPGGSESERDEPGTWEARYEPWVVEGDRAVATGTSRYWSDASHTTGERVYHNIFLLEFDAEGRCRAFTEVFAQRPIADRG